MSSLSIPLWTALLAVFLFWIGKFAKWSWKQLSVRRSLRENWPHVPCHWFWGHLTMISPDDPEKLISFMKNSSKVFTYGGVLYVGPILALLRVCHQTVFKMVLGGSEQNYPKSKAQYKTIHPWLGTKGLLILEGKEWQRHRHLLTKSFHLGILKSYLSKVNACSKFLVKKWHRRMTPGQGTSIEVFQDVSMMTLDSILQCLMTLQSNCQMEDSCHQAYISSVHAISSLVSKRVRSKNLFLQFDCIYRLSKNGRRFYRNCIYAREYAEKVIEDRRREYVDGTIIGGEQTFCDDNNDEGIKYDLLHVLLQAKDSGGNHLTNEEVSDEVNTFIFAGHDTTSSAISWTCYCLASNPVHQEKCYAEIVKVLGHKEDIEWEDLSKLEYLTMCIKEAMRIFPPVPSIIRQSGIDSVVEGRPIKQGTVVVMSVLSLHFNPKLWPDPDAYVPLRFTPENCAKRDPYAYVPFSAGPRNCIGQNFAMNEIKVSMAHILQHFFLEKDESKPCVQAIEIIYRTKGGLHLMVTPRKSD